MMSDNCGRKAGIWNYWAVGAIKYGWAGTLLGEIKFIALITAAFCEGPRYIIYAIEFLI